MAIVNPEVGMDTKELDRRLKAMVGLVREHILEKHPEKGPWRGEDPRSRSDLVAARARKLHDITLGRPVSPNSDGSEPNARSELTKLLSSAFIYGDLQGFWGPLRDGWQG